MTTSIPARRPASIPACATPARIDIERKVTTMTTTTTNTTTNTTTTASTQIVNHYTTMTRKEKQEARKKAASMREKVIKACKGDRTPVGIPVNVWAGCVKRSNVGIAGKDTLTVASTTTFCKVLNTTGKPIVKVMGK